MVCVCCFFSTRLELHFVGTGDGDSRLVMRVQPRSLPKWELDSTEARLKKFRSFSVVRHGRRKSLIIGVEIRFRARSSDTLSSLLRVFYVRLVADMIV